MPESTRQLAQELLERIDEEESKICPALALDTLGLGFLTALKEFDFYFYNLTRAEASGLTEEHFYLMKLGVPRFVEKLLESIPQFGLPVATFKSDELLIKGALQVLTHFGFIEHGRRMCYASLAGECTIRKIDDSRYEFRLPEVLHNYEATEAHVEAHYRQAVKRKRDALIDEWLAKDSLADHLNDCFRDNVYVFHQNFIGYSAHPDLDEVFFGFAYSDLLHRSAVDVFHFDLTFGGLKYLHYTLCLTYLLSITLKHERFCEALLEKHPHIRLRDILTVTSDKNGFIAGIQSALNHYGPRFEGYTQISIAQAEQLYRVFSVGRGNLQMLRNTSICTPCLVEYSNSAVVKTIAGSQLDSGNFLLQSLRLHYPDEYDINQQTRERSMQKALQRLLTEVITAAKFRRNLRLRVDGVTLTDVDFIAIDEADGTVIFFQLKYQDHYGMDFRKRSSKGARLRTETEDWLKASKKWLEVVPKIQIHTALQLKKHIAINRVFLVAIGQQFAHFLAPLAADDDFAYSNWIQFYDSLIWLSSAPSPKNLHTLFSLLRSHMTHRVSVPQKLDEETVFHLETLSYQVVQEAGDRGR